MAKTSRFMRTLHNYNTHRDPRLDAATRSAATVTADAAARQTACALRPTVREGGGGGGGGEQGGGACFAQGGRLLASSRGAPWTAWVPRAAVGSGVGSSAVPGGSRAGHSSHSASASASASAARGVCGR